MSAENHISMIGNLGKAPELKYAPKGTAILEFSIAVRKFMAKKDDKPDWFDVVVFGKQAESLHNLLDKGTKVCVEGRLTKETYVSKKTQQNVTSYKIVANDVAVLAGKKQAGASEDFQEEESEEEAPF